MRLSAEETSRTAIAGPRCEDSRLPAHLFLALLFSLAITSWIVLRAQESEDAPDSSGEYHFLAPQDTLSILEEEGKIKGSIDVYQGEEESDDVLSYPITIGSRNKSHVEFKTGKIHQKYYRFSGTVQRGLGHKEGDPDYLRLAGDLEIITAKADSAVEETERKQVTFKSLGKSEKAEREQE